MRIPKETIEAVRERTDIVEVIGRSVTLKKRGRNFLGLCPFHQEKTPSFNVLPDRQIYHCFGCGVGGDVFRFLMETQGLNFAEAVKELAGPAGVQVEEKELTREDRVRIRRRASLHDACAAAADWFQANLLTRPEGLAAREYLERRGMSRELIERARLGFAPEGWSNLLDHLHREGIDGEVAERAGLARRSDRGRGRYDVFRARLIFPIFDSRDRPIAFGGRLLEGEGPKYLNSPESEIYDKSSTLYGLSWARTYIQRNDRVIVVEGYFDVLSLLQAGFGEAVATCGTSLTASHARQLRRLTGTAIALFDGDEAGMRAADRSLSLFLDAGLEARHLALPDNKDPDDFVQEFGPDAFEKALGQSTPLLELALRRAAERHGTTPGGRQRAAQEVAPLLRKLPGILGSDMLIRTANLLQLSEPALRKLIGTPDQPGERRDPAATARWVPAPELKRLLWLLIHFPEQVAPAVSQTDPQVVTDREDVLWTIAQLLSGTGLVQILPQLNDPDLEHMLRAAAAHEGLHDADGALSAARQALARLELRALEAQVVSLHQEVSALEGRSDWERTRALLEQKQALQKRIHALRPQATGRRS